MNEKVIGAFCDVAQRLAGECLALAHQAHCEKQGTALPELLADALSIERLRREASVPRGTKDQATRARAWAAQQRLRRLQHAGLLPRVAQKR